MPEDHDAGSRNAALGVVDDKIAVFPQAERADREVTLSLAVREGRREHPCLLLALMVTHLEAQGHKRRKRASGVIVRQPRAQRLRRVAHVSAAAIARVPATNARSPSASRVLRPARPIACA